MRVEWTLGDLVVREATAADLTEHTISPYGRQQIFDNSAALSDESGYKPIINSLPASLRRRIIWPSVHRRNQRIGLTRLDSIGYATSGQYW